MTGRQPEPIPDAVEKHVAWRKARAAINRLEPLIASGHATKADRDKLKRLLLQVDALQPLPPLTREQAKELNNGRPGPQQKTRTPKVQRAQPARITRVVHGGAPGLGKRS